MNISESLSRVFEATGTRTQVELADFLDIRQSSISDAKRRGSIPDNWLVTILRKANVNPEWILTGQGGRFMVPSDSQSSFLLDGELQKRTNDLRGQIRDELARGMTLDEVQELLRAKLPAGTTVQIHYEKRLTGTGEAMDGVAPSAFQN
jgi:hypothetical protein